MSGARAHMGAGAGEFVEPPWGIEPQTFDDEKDESSSGGSTEVQKLASNWRNSLLGSISMSEAMTLVTPAPSRDVGGWSPAAVCGRW